MTRGLFMAPESDLVVAVLLLALVSIMGRTFLCVRLFLSTVECVFVPQTICIVPSPPRTQPPQQHTITTIAGKPLAQPQLLRTPGMHTACAWRAHAGRGSICLHGSYPQNGCMRLRRRLLVQG